MGVLELLAPSGDLERLKIACLYGADAVYIGGYNYSLRANANNFSIDEIKDPRMWIKANPNLGKTVTYETYQNAVEKAENVPAARNDILAKRFGIPMEGYTYYFTYEETIPHRKRDYWKSCRWCNSM